MNNLKTSCAVQPYYHFIGIGGIGMSALARILLDQKSVVTGSDSKPSEITRALSAKGATLFYQHKEENVKSGAIVVVSSGIKSSNVELQEAYRLNCPIIHRSDLLYQLMSEKRSLAIAGTHGKTTTSSLLSEVLVSAGYDPSFAVGGIIHGLADSFEASTVNGRQGLGDYFIAEADESDGTFLKYHPYGAILTNVEADHLDHYHCEENIHAAFEQFFGQVKEDSCFFYCGDDELLKKIASQQKKGISYGFSETCALQITNFQQNGWSICYTISFKNKFYENIEVALTGRHNALNSAAVFGLALNLGLNEDQIRLALKAFKGVGRRCQKHAEVGDILILDDYGHHPTEVLTTISAVKTAVKNRRLIVVFQPHRYTRTRDFFEQFSEAFDLADKLYITDIYSAGEEPIDGISHDSIIQSIFKRNTVSCNYLPKDSWLSITKDLQPNDVVLTLGAGTITNLGPELAKTLAELASC